MGPKLLRIPIMLLFLLCLSNWPLPALFAQKTPAEGEMFPELKLPVPQKMEQREYLNADQDPFALSAVDSEVLIVEIFNFYCPHCQKEAPNVNALYKAISASPEMKSRIKVLGIGAGNSAHEVNAFRDLFRIEYPLIPDGDFTAHKALGQVPNSLFLCALEEAHRLAGRIFQGGEHRRPIGFSATGTHKDRHRPGE